MKLPTIEKAIAIMEGGLPSRPVDCLLYAHTLRINSWRALDPEEGPPEYVPRYTQEFDKAFVLLSRIAPYASYRIDHDAMACRFDVVVLGQRARGAALAPTICHALLKHIHHRGSRVEGRIQGRLETATVMDGRNARPPSRGALAVAADYASIEKRAMAHMADHFSGMSAKAAEAALKLRDRRYLTADSTDDDWCSAISSCGFAPRDLIAELEAIKKAVFAMRGEQ